MRRLREAENHLPQTGKQLRACRQKWQASRKGLSFVKEVRDPIKSQANLLTFARVLHLNHGFGEMLIDGKQAKVIDYLVSTWLDADRA